jgi:hypothetical protein
VCYALAGMALLLATGKFLVSVGMPTVDDFRDVKIHLLHLSNARAPVPHVRPARASRLSLPLSARSPTRRRRRRTFRLPRTRCA